LSQIADKKFEATTPDLKQNIVGFYSHPGAPILTKTDPGKWQKVQTNLDALKALTPNPSQPPAPAAQPAAASPSGGR
jgi:hypothetical protein